MSDDAERVEEGLDLAAPAHAAEDIVSSGDHRVDRAWALAAIGAFFFLPVTAAAFSAPLQVFGLPILWVYLFGVWLLLIFGAAALSFSRGPRSARRVEARDVNRTEP